MAIDKRAFPSLSSLMISPPLPKISKYQRLMYHFVLSLIFFIVVCMLMVSYIFVHSHYFCRKMGRGRGVTRGFFVTSEMEWLHFCKFCLFCLGKQIYGRSKGSLESTVNTRRGGCRHVKSTVAWDFLPQKITYRTCVLRFMLSCSLEWEPLSSADCVTRTKCT